MWPFLLFIKEKGKGNSMKFSESLKKNNRLFKNLLSGEIIFDYNTTIFNNCQSVFEKLIDIFLTKV